MFESLLITMKVDGDFIMAQKSGTHLASYFKFACSDRITFCEVHWHNILKQAMQVTNSDLYNEVTKHYFLWR